MTVPELTRDHVARADLPWRKSGLTECGRKISSVTSCTTAEVVLQRERSLGKQRTAFTVCMTCWQASANYQTWEQDPTNVMARHCQRWGRENELDQLRAELRAIAALIEAHRDEFDDYLQGLSETIDLARRRRRIS